MKHICCISALLGVALCGAARADIVFDTGNSPGGVDNVLANTASDIFGPALTVRGHVSGTSTFVDFRSNENLAINASGGGQATISAETNGFGLMDIFLTDPPGGVFTKIVFALSGYGSGPASQVPFVVTVTEGNGSTDSAGYTTGSGDTFYTIVAISGQDIRNVNLTTSDGFNFDTLKQVRIGGGAVVVPEPASILGLGTVLLLLGSRLRRKRP